MLILTAARLDRFTLKATTTTAVQHEQHHTHQTAA
jgi:hypothetical protein